MVIILAITARITLGCVFLYTGLRKLRYPRRFARAIESFDLAPAPTIVALAFLIPSLECVCGASLLFGAGVVIQLAALALGGLLLVFSLALAIAWWRQRIVVCNCFGSAEAEEPAPTSYLPSLTRNALLLSGALAACLSPSAAYQFLAPTLAVSRWYQEGALIALGALSLGWFITSQWTKRRQRESIQIWAK